MTFEPALIQAIVACVVLACSIAVGWHKLTRTAEAAESVGKDLKEALKEHAETLRTSLEKHEAKFVPRNEVMSMATEAANKVGEAAAKDLAEFKLKVAERYVDKDTYGAGIVENSRKLDSLTAKLDRILEWLFTGNLPETSSPSPTPPRPRRSAAS